MKALFLITAALLSFYGTFAPATVQPHTHPTEKPVPKPLTLSEVIDTCAKFYSIPREVIVGVAFSETGIGTDGVGREEAARNLFGVRKGKYDKHPDTMVYNCSNGAFRKCHTKAESVADFCRFIHQYYPWFFTRPRPIERWLLYGYGNSKYEVKGYFLKFNDYKV